MMGAPPPNPRDLPPTRQDSWGNGSSIAPPPLNPGTESALGFHPWRALPSAQMPNSLNRPANLCHPVGGRSPLIELRTTLFLVQPMGSTSEAGVAPATHIAVDEVTLASFDELLDGSAGMGVQQ